MKYILISISLLFSPLAAANELPDGWVHTSPDQYLKEDIAWYKGALPNKVVADFNGDKIPDVAWVLTNPGRSKFGLFVSLSSGSSNYQIIQLVENEIKHHIFVGISAQKPGEYKTACGKGYWECKNGEPGMVKLNLTCIDYFVFESANSIFCWSKKELKFKRIWMSD